MIRKAIVIVMYSLCTLAVGDSPSPKSLTEREALETQHKWLKCMAMRQIVYMAMDHQTKPIAFILTEGQSVTLDSWLCLLPKQSSRINVRWRFLSLEGAAIRFIEQNGDKHFVDQNSKDLELNLVTKQDSGFYFANVNNDHDTAVYFVEVSDTDHVDEVKHVDHESEFKPPVHVLPLRNLKISLRLYDWSICSRCDKVGIKYRFAICFVELIDTKSPIKPNHHPVFDQFFAGLPCKSAFLPEEIRNLTEVKDTKSIHLKSFCQINCPTSDSLADQTDDFDMDDLHDTSKLFTTIKNRFADISKKLTISSTVAATSVFQEQYKGVILNCPGKVTPGLPIIWKRNETLLIADRLIRLSQGRIAIDSAGQMRFRKIINSDSNTYSCWVGGRLVGTVQLVVKDRFQPPSIRQTDTYANILSYCLTFTAMVYITWKVLQSRRIHSFP